jgi:hypothetical protein
MRPTKRELTNAVEDLEAAFTDDRDRKIVVMPAGSLREEDHDDDLPNGDSDEIHVERDGRRSVAIPHMTPESLDRGIVPLSKSHIARWWQILPPEIRERERELREQDDEPIPPILETEP